MKKLLLLFAILISSVAQSQTQDINITLDQTYKDESRDVLAESGVYDMEDGTIIVVQTASTGFATRKGMRKRALKQLKRYQQWNPVKVKQINERYRTLGVGVTPKLTMIFKVIE